MRFKFGVSILLSLGMLTNSFSQVVEFDNPTGRKKYEVQRLSDPQTDEIPPNIRFKEIAFFNTKGFRKASNPLAIEGTPWMHRGPYHIGGRTRAAAMDVTNEERIVSGGVSGGLWLSENSGKSWTPTQDAFAISSVSCLTQDRRKGYEQNWYVGTGEAYGQSAGSPGAYYYGNGLLKSSDGAKSWEGIKSTEINNPTGFASPWQLVWDILVDTTRYDSTILYAATYQNIMRSNDGGESWTVVRNTGAYFNDLEMDANGVIYSSSSADGRTGEKGVFRTINGWDWQDITPTDWQGRDYNRVVIGCSNSKLTLDTQTRVYLLLNTESWGKPAADSRGELEWNALFRLSVSPNYDVKPYNETDLTENLPISKYPLNSFRTQGSYDMLVGVFPEKGENDIVFIGGTNIHRSTTGFTDSQHTILLAGYKENTSLPYFEAWHNQHPDQHVWMHYPSNPKKVLSGNDGGIFITEDCLSDQISWSSANAGYLTTQFYTVALDPSTNMSSLLVAGAQDNNQIITDDFDPTATWDIAYPGDGSYCAVEPGAKYAYFSKQLGNTIKAELDDKGKVQTFRRIDPKGVKRRDYQFINPLVLDPADKNILYLAGGRFIWRNNKLNEIVLDSTTEQYANGWKQSSDSLRLISAKISALGVSNAGHRLYFGTNLKYLYRIDSAHVGDLKFTALKTPTGIQTNSNVSCIAVHPDNPDELIVSYSNYNVYSLFLSKDAGNSWVKIGGNLEENSNGMGNGPSLRWVKYVPVKDGMVYMVGTSMGLFACDSLQGENTEWVHQAPGEIGTAVVDMIDYRKVDGTLAVATHGRGLFYARIFEKGAILSEEKISSSNEIEIFPNPGADVLRMRSSEDVIQKVTIVNASGKKVDEISPSNRRIEINTESWNRGLYFLIVETHNGKSWFKWIKDQ